MALKVLNVTVSLNPKGGGWPERTIQMSRALAGAGAQCSILAFDEGFSYHVDGVRLETLSASTIGPRLAWVLPVFSLGRIKALVASVDVVHLMGFRSFLNAVVFRYAKQLGKPVVICPAGSLPSYGSPVNRLLKRLFDVVAGDAMTRSADACIAVTVIEKEALIAHGFSSAKLHVLPNAVFKSDFVAQAESDFRLRYGLGDAKLILFLGRLTHIKGPDLLLHAFARLSGTCKEYHLVFAGPDAGMRKELEADAKQMEIADRVHFLGHVGQPDKSHAYHAAELIVIPSRQEAMSIVALEGGVAGTPVLLTNACGFSEIASVDGRLIAAPSVDGLETSMRQLLEDDIGLKAIGESLSQFIEKEYSWEAMAQRYLALYQALTGLP